METKKRADELRKRILRLGQQKLEEERLFQQLAQAVDRPPVTRKTKNTQRPTPSEDVPDQAPTSRL